MSPKMNSPNPQRMNLTPRSVVSSTVTLGLAIMHLPGRIRLGTPCQALAATPPLLVFPAVGTASQHTPLQLNPAQQPLRACERADSCFLASVPAVLTMCLLAIPA